MSLTKEVFRLRRKVGKVTDGQVSVLDFKPDELSEMPEGMELIIAVEPNDGLYKGGRFTFLIYIPDGYPHTNKIPVVFCNCSIIHPNIDPYEGRYEHTETNVCLNILEYGAWNNSFGLEGIVHGILFLLHNPNFDDPLSPFFESSDPEEGRELVEQFMSGKEVEGLKLADNYERTDTDPIANENEIKVEKEIDGETNNGAVEGNSETKEITKDVAANSDSVEDNTSNKAITGDVAANNDSVEDNISNKEITGDVAANNDSVEDNTSNKVITGDDAANNDSVEDNTSNKEITGDVAANNDSVEYNISNKEITGDVAANNDSVEDTNSNKEITGDVAANNDSVEDTNSNKEITGNVAANNDSVEDNISNKEKIEDTATNTDLVEDSNANKDAIEGDDTDKTDAENMTDKNANEGTIPSELSKDNVDVYPYDTCDKDDDDTQSDADENVGYKMIVIDGEVLLVPYDFSDELESNEASNALTTDNQNADTEKHEQTPNDNDIPAANIKDNTECNEDLPQKEYVRQISNQIMSDQTVSEESGAVSLMVNADDNVATHKPTDWSTLLDCMCGIQPKKATLIDKAIKRLFTHFRSVGRKVLLLFDTDR